MREVSAANSRSNTVVISPNYFLIFDPWCFDVSKTSLVLSENHRMWQEGLQALEWGGVTLGGDTPSVCISVSQHARGHQWNRAAPSTPAASGDLYCFCCLPIHWWKNITQRESHSMGIRRLHYKFKQRARKNKNLKSVTFRFPWIPSISLFCCVRHNFKGVFPTQVGQILWLHMKG